MRQIDYIVLHCTSTPQTTTVDSIKNYWGNVIGWRNPGYHYIIQPNGKIKILQNIEKIANGVKGYNDVSIHISYIGGVDKNNMPIDNRTKEQKEAQITLLRALCKNFPKAKIKGHNEFPGVKKACPSFDVQKWLKTVTV